MKLNKEKIRALAALDDAQLWKEIRSAAQRFGYTLPENAPNPSDMAKIRTVMSEADKISAMDMARLLSSFKEKRKKE